MKSLQRKYDLIDEARALEIALLREYFEQPHREAMIGRLITKAQARIERRCNAYLAALSATTKELAQQWPSLEDMPDGVDLFLEQHGTPTGKEEED